MRNVRLIFAVVLLVFLSASFSSGRVVDTLGQIRARGLLRVGVRTHSPPFGSVDPNGQYEGFDVDMARLVSKQLFGHEDAVELIPVTPENDIAILKSGRIDVVIAATAITQGREKMVDFSIPYFVSGHLVLTRKGERIGSYRDLAGKKVATIAGSTSDTSLRRLTPSSIRIRFDTASQAIEALKQHRVDAFVGDDTILIDAESDNPELVIPNWQPFSIVRYGMAVRKGDKEWLNFLNSTLRQVEKSVEYRKLLEKWFGMARALVYERMISPR